MIALRCWGVGAPHIAVPLLTYDTAPSPLLEAGYGAVVVRWTVRD
ncbi:hypothetical protein ACMGDM_17975 [Sphingomonas sp. DT-51]